MADSNYYSVTLEFRDVPPENPFTLTIYERNNGQWSLGDVTETEGGLNVAAADDETPVQFRNLTVTAKQVIVYAGTEKVSINLSLWVNTDQPSVSGEATLPPGAVCTIRSGPDRTSVTKSGSWSIQLHR